MVDPADRSRVGRGVGSAPIGSVSTVQVPEALRLYLARRCDDPEALLVDLLRATAPGRSLSIPPGEDVHRGIRACSLQATTVISRLPSAVKVTIVRLKDWTVHAGPTSTDLILNYLPEVLRAGSGQGPLRDRFEVSFLPSDLEIQALIDQGAGALIRCQPVTFDIAFAVPDGNQGLSDVSGHVSEPGGRF